MTGGDSRRATPPALVIAVVSLLGPSIAWAQRPATDIVVLEAAELAGPQVNPLRITNRDLYDNQPSFLPGGELVFSAAGEDGSTDIVRFDFESEQAETLFDFEESLYSPTPVPGEGAISVVRDYGHQQQQLWKLPLDGGGPTVLQKDINPIGYHAWVNSDTLILFVLGDPPTLQAMTVGSAEGRFLQRNPGRALARIPVDRWGEGAMSFVRPTAEEDVPGNEGTPTALEIVALQVESGEVRPITDLLPGHEDYAWAPDGSLWMGQGTLLMRWEPDQWTEIADLAKSGLGEISRLAWSPRGDRLAIVVER